MTTTSHLDWHQEAQTGTMGCDRQLAHRATCLKSRHAGLMRLVSGCGTGMPIEGEKCKEAARVGLVTVGMQSLKLTFPAVFPGHYVFYPRTAR